MLYSVEQLPRCDLLRLIPLLGGFVLSERRDLHYFIFTFVTARGSNWGAKFLVRKRRVVVIGKRDIFKVRRRVVVIGGLTGSGSRPPPIFFPYYINL